MSHGQNSVSWISWGLYWILISRATRLYIRSFDRASNLPVSCQVTGVRDKKAFDTAREVLLPLGSQTMTTRDVGTGGESTSDTWTSKILQILALIPRSRACGPRFWVLRRSEEISRILRKPWTVLSV